MTRAALAVLALAAFALALAAALALAGPGDLDRGFGPGGTRTDREHGIRRGDEPSSRTGRSSWPASGNNGDVAVGAHQPRRLGRPCLRRHSPHRLRELRHRRGGGASARRQDRRRRPERRRTPLIARLEPRRLARHGLRHDRQARNRLRGADLRSTPRASPSSRTERSSWPASAASTPTDPSSRGLEPDGADAPGFGPGGTRRVNFGLGYEEGRTLALQPDGKIVVAGFTGGNRSLGGRGRAAEPGRLARHGLRHGRQAE